MNKKKKKKSRNGYSRYGLVRSIGVLNGQHEIGLFLAQDYFVRLDFLFVSRPIFEVAPTLQFVVHLV